MRSHKASWERPFGEYLQAVDYWLFTQWHNPSGTEQKHMEFIASCHENMITPRNCASEIDCGAWELCEFQSEPTIPR